MNLVSVAARNVLRNRFRTALTILGGAVAVIAFVLLRTVLHAWNVGVEYAAKDRLATRHKVSIVIPLPKRYLDDVKANVTGIKAVTYANWFGAKWPKDPNEFFANLAVDDDFMAVFPEMSMREGSIDAWKQDKKGAIVGDVLAKKLGIKLGDRVTLQGTIFPGDWEFTVDAIYTAPLQSSVDRSSFYFHWSYLNDSIPPNRRDTIGWIISRVDDPAKGPEISAAIDRLFDDRDVQTATMSERAMNNGFLGGFSALLLALNVVSVIILVIMMLILGNTIAMGVRERTTEYGVLRALGFLPGHIRLFIVGEAATIGLLAGALGLLLAYPLVQLEMGRWIEENMGSFFPSFRIAPETMVAGLLITVAVSIVGSFVPALRAGRVAVTEALRRIA